MGTPTKLLMGKDIQGQQSTPFAELPFSNTIFAFTLVATVPVTVGVPLGADTVNFSFTKADDVWVDWQGTAAIPLSSAELLLEDGDSILLEDGDDLLLEGFGVAGTTMLNPVSRTVMAGDELSFISATDAGVSLEFYNKYSTGRY